MTPREIALAVGAFYVCPRRRQTDGTVKYLGPLAGYTSKGADGRQRLGFEYLNFGKIAEHPEALREVVRRMVVMAYDDLLAQGVDRPVFCGIPTGGASIVREMQALGLTDRCIWAEKRAVGRPTDTTRAETEIWFPPEHEPCKGEMIVLVEDIGNALSTTGRLTRQVRDYGAEVVMYVYFLLRSPEQPSVLVFDGERIPISALWREPMALYDMSDPRVAGEVARGNFRLQTKEYWYEFMAAMEEAATFAAG